MKNTLFLDNEPVPFDSVALHIFKITENKVEIHLSRNGLHFLYAKLPIAFRACFGNGYRVTGSLTRIGGNICTHYSGQGELTCTTPLHELYHELKLEKQQMKQKSKLRKLIERLCSC